ncbi:MAG: metal-dependent hydrolase [Stagnimonas sp.]|nr:metal-dependent hydrolase [Stagnimonas sp.]
MDNPQPVRRDLHFALDASRVKDWHGQGEHVSQFFNTMSLYFPEGEKFFINSVRHYRDRISDPRLQEAVNGFIGQEAMHGREHRVYNEMLQEAGLPAQRIEDFSLNRLKMAHKIFSPAMQLSMTIALEHLTAIMAAHMLKTPGVLAGSEPGYARLWRWHALEETEHKAVAFDVWRTVMPPTLGSYIKRCWGLIQTSWFFWLFTAIFQWQMSRAARPKESHWRGYGRLFRFLFVKPAAWLALAPAWFAYFKPGFHPWEHDNRAALAELPVLVGELQAESR